MKGKNIIQERRIPEIQFYRDSVIQKVRDFAYDPQLQLFPDSATEEARTALKKAFDSGKQPKVDLYLVAKNH